MSFNRNIYFLVFTVLFFSGCTTIDLYEKNETIPGHKWESSFKPSFSFDIKDTSVPYQVFIIVRHNEKYHFNNIWLDLYTQLPGDSASSKVQYELPLANNEGWLASGMDDIYEHRVALTPNSEKFYFKKAGTYKFTLEQIMREDPLENVMNIGLRIEKKSP